jgi:6-phosphogluconolactonase
MLTNRASIAPGKGINFQPRHLDFHPTKPCVFCLAGAAMQTSGITRRCKATHSATIPCSSKTPYRNPAISDPHNLRALFTCILMGDSCIRPPIEQYNGLRRLAGLCRWRKQHCCVCDQPGHRRTHAHPKRGYTRFSAANFSLDPSGRILVVGNQIALSVRDGKGVRVVRANVSVYKIREDGKTRVRTRIRRRVGAVGGA